MKKIWYFYMKNLEWILLQIYQSPIGKYLTPNRISYFRTVLGWFAIVLMSLGYEWIALTLMIVSLYLDHIDGVWARLFRQTTKWGGYVDRTCDKLLIIPFLIYLEYFKPFFICKNEFFFYTVIQLITIELIALNLSIFQWIVEWVPYNISFKKDNSAIWPGKVKMLLECTLIILILTFHTVKSQKLLIEVLLFICLSSFIMATISLVGHIRTMQFKKLSIKSFISKPSS